jgi:Mg2+ and Co2+ transporter CorA
MSEIKKESVSDLIDAVEEGLDQVRDEVGTAESYISDAEGSLQEVSYNVTSAQTTISDVEDILNELRKREGDFLKNDLAKKLGDVLASITQANELLK